MTDTVETYLACMAAHDWDGLAATLADAGLTRDGPFCDRVEGFRRAKPLLLQELHQANRRNRAPEVAGGVGRLLAGVR